MNGYLKFEGNGKIPLGVREKGLPCWLSQFSNSTETAFKPKVAIAKFIGKMQKKSGIMKSGLDAMLLFLLDDLLKNMSHI